MSLIRKIFGTGGGSGNSGDSRPAPEVADSAPSTVSGDDGRARAASRRELVHNALRETIRQHGIPKDWIGCRVLAVVSRTKKAGVHVQFIVRKGDDQLMAYVHQFQEGFWRAMDQVDPTARQWIFSLAWQFDGKASPGAQPIQVAPEAQAAPGDTVPEYGDTMPAEEDAIDLESDLAALYAIRDAAMITPPEPPSGHGR